MRHLHRLGCVFTAAACTGSGRSSAIDEEACNDGGESSAAVIWSLTFARIDETGRTQGFDLDGFSTTENSSTGCGVPDQIGLDGSPGVDNAMANLIPILELTEASAVEDILRDGIRSGELLLMVELEDVANTEHDPCVDLTLSQGSGTPLLSTLNEILPGQTFARDSALPRQRLGGMEMFCGEVEGGPIELGLPFRVLGVDLDVHLSEGAIRVTVHADGSMTGIIGGGLDIDYLLEVAHHPNVDPEVASLMETLLVQHADLDLDGDGVCELISTSLVFEAAQTYLID